MKNLLIYINPLKDFDEETKILAKIQIDNILDLGWKRQDIMFVTNFPYEYNGVKAMVFKENIPYLLEPSQNKISGILLLFELGLISNSELYFCHDFDHYQLHPISESEIELALDTADMGITDYGRVPRWHMSSIFFKKSARDIFELLKDTVMKLKMPNEEDALFMLTENNTQGVKKRIKKLNITYNFWGGNINSTYPMAEKPIKCVHFHPTADKVDFFMYGKNKVNKILINERLIKIFKKYGIK